MWQLSPDGATAKCVTIIYPHSRAVKSVAFHPREPIIATGSYGTASRVWRISIHAASPIPTPFFTLAGQYGWLRSIAFDPTGHFLATCSSDLTTKIWRVQIDGTIDEFPIAFLSGNSFNVTTVAFDSTGCFLATGNIDGMTELWRVQPDDDTNWTSVAILSGHSSFVNSIAFYPDGLFLVTGSDDKTVKIWMLFSDKSLAKCIHTVKYRIKVKQVQFHPLGNILAIVLYDGSLIFYDCSALTATSMRLKLLATQGTAGLLAKRLYTHPSMPFNPKLLQDTTGKVDDDENLALHRSLVTSGEAQAKATDNLKKKNQSGSGGRISQRKRKINKRNSYRK
jgi:WD40 repeat protein